MPRIGHREFLLKAGKAGLGLSLAPQLVGLAGCRSSSANAVTDASGGYDAIIVGGGTAGTIVAAKLQAPSGGRKRIVIIEAGGPTGATIGGTDFPPWRPAGRIDLSVVDVPGDYSLVAFQPAGALSVSNSNSRVKIDANGKQFKGNSGRIVSAV